MADTPTSPSRTMSSEAAQKSSTPKDKTCPYCHQPFTSSSLGRHLDLYIKPHNPKPPDGVHDVEEIRRVRGGVTRRQPRTSGKRDSSTPGSVPPTSRDPHSRNSNESAVSIMRSPPYRASDRMGLGSMNWQATGVINDLPPRKPTHAQDLSSSRHKDAYHKRQKIDRQQRLRTADELDNGLAAQMALKEILWTIKDAKTHLMDSDPLDSSLFEQTFPTLCLTILDAPPTLFSPAPFPSPTSWSISPPGDAQFDALCRAIRERAKSYVSTHTQTEQEPDPERYGLPFKNREHVDPDTLIGHVSKSFDGWMALPTATRSEIWQLEVLRCLAKVQSERRQLQRDLDAARAKVQRLRNEPIMVESSTAANTRKYMDYPSSFPLSKDAEVARLIDSLQVDDLEWSYDNLLHKWREFAKSKREARANDQTSLPSVDQIAGGGRSSPYVEGGYRLKSAATSQAEINAAYWDSDIERDRQADMDIDEETNPKTKQSPSMSARRAYSSSIQPHSLPTDAMRSHQRSFRSISPTGPQLPPIHISEKTPRHHDDHHQHSAKK